MQLSRQILVDVGSIGILAVLGAPRLAVALLAALLKAGRPSLRQKFEKSRPPRSKHEGRKSATSCTTSTANTISLAAAIASTLANGRSATASLSVTDMGG
jgi:hypothetical protein